MKSSVSTKITVATSEYGFEIPVIEVTGLEFLRNATILHLTASIYELAGNGKVDLRLWAAHANLGGCRVELEPCESAKTADGLRILKTARASFKGAEVRRSR